MGDRHHGTPHEGRPFYACVVLDGFSWEASGWATDRKEETRLANSALYMAWSTRHTNERGVIHANQGTQSVHLLGVYQERRQIRATDEPWHGW